MSTSGTKETCILEDPNAVGHMDALFDVLRKPNNGGTGAGRSASSKRNSRSNSGNNRKAASAAAELVCGGPTADVEFLLDALFAVVETDSGSGRGRGRRRPGRAAAATAMARGAAAAKSWKERKLPASFFDAGGGVSTGPSAGKEEALDAAEGIEDGSPIPSPDSESSRQVTNSSSHPGLAQLPVVLVNTSSTESLTFYIDKHLQCRVNMEPALERRRRLARGRVQKYRSMKKRRKPRKSDGELGDNSASCS
jgi:hypothetical protein